MDMSSPFELSCDMNGPINLSINEANTQKKRPMRVPAVIPPIRLSLCTLGIFKLGFIRFIMTVNMIIARVKKTIKVI